MTDVILVGNPTSHQFYGFILEQIAEAEAIVQKTGQVESAFPVVIDCRRIRIRPLSLTKVRSQVRSDGYDIQKVGAYIEITVWNAEAGPAAVTNPILLTCQFVPGAGTNIGIVCGSVIYSGTRCRAHMEHVLNRAKAYSKLYHASAANKDRLLVLQQNLSRNNAKCFSSYQTRRLLGSLPDDSPRCKYVYVNKQRRGEGCNKKCIDDFCRLHTSDLNRNH